LNDLIFAIDLATVCRFLHGYSTAAFEGKVYEKNSLPDFTKSNNFFAVCSIVR
jgi:hypothetical protein